MKKLLYLFVMLFVLQGCTTEEVIEDYITLEESSLSCDEHANTLTLQFSATTKWEAEVVDQNKNNWVTISPTSGEAGESTITIQTKNNSTTESRYATICITVGTIQQTVTITQKQNDVIVLAEGEYTLDKEGEVFELELQANVDITVSIPDNDKNWIEFVESRAVSDKILCFNIAANTTGKERKSTITISGGNATQTINVTQESLLPSNQIWYTSTDEQPLSKDFGTGLQSHTYENGKGVLIFNDDVTAITEGMFDYCETLATISLPNNVTVIEGGAFCGCSSLESINVPDGVTEIGNYAFNDCSNLTSINIPDGVTEIGGFAFYRCSRLTSITIPNGITKIGDNTFYGCNSLTTITIPDSVTEIGMSAFSGCNKLTDVSLTDNITEMGEYAFNGCSSLTTFTIPNNVTAISANTFKGCRSLTAINIHDKITSIGRGAFNGCNGLQSVTIGNSVTKIDGYAFAVNNVSLASLTIPESVTEIGSNAFSGMTVDELTINGAVVEAPFTGLFWHTNFTFKKLTIGDNIKKIGDHAFAGCKVEIVEIGNGVTSIDQKAFYNCSNLTSINIPSSVTSIGSEAFKDCSKLTEVNCEPTTPPTLGKSAFVYNASSRIIVPLASVDAYKTASGWSDYANFIGGYNPDAPNQWGTLPILNKETMASKMLKEWDRGGEGVGYLDMSNRNGNTPDVDWSGNIGYTANGEWLAYTIYVEDAGTYRFTLYGSSSASSGTYSGEYQWFLDDPYIEDNALGPRFKQQSGGLWSGPWMPSEPVEFELEKGYQRIILYMHNAAHNLYNFTAEWAE